MFEPTAARSGKIQPRSKASLSNGEQLLSRYCEMPNKVVDRIGAVDICRLQRIMSWIQRMTRSFSSKKCKKRTFPANRSLNQSKHRWYWLIGNDSSSWNNKAIGCRAAPGTVDVFFSTFKDNMLKPLKSTVLCMLHLWRASFCIEEDSSNMNEMVFHWDYILFLFTYEKGHVMHVDVTHHMPARAFEV